MEYDVTPRGYLDRARVHLLSDQPDRLPYAAFELRCCIEARQADYLGAVQFGQKSKIKAWKTGAVAKNLRIYWNNPKIAEIIYCFDEEKFVTYFTPVTKRAVTLVERVAGRFLHALRPSTIHDSNWLLAGKQELTELYKEAWIACRGEHISMPLWNRDTKEMNPTLLHAGDELLALMHKLKEFTDHKREMQFAISYLEDPPENWICNL